MLPTPASFRPESLVETTIDGRYQLLAHIASGGMGAIFRAHHVYMRKDLALKVLRPDLSTLPDIAERFRREAEIAASLEHENIVRVTDFGRSPEGWFFLAMELLEGESLFDRLRRGPLAPEDAIRILVQICRGLEAAHGRGVVHRDLKPENIFLTSRPPGLVKVLDFGIAKLTDPGTASDTQAGVVVGTPEYLSPEQATGGVVDGRADVYSVGLIGWRMLAGHHPFSSTDARGLLMMQATRPVPPLTDSRPDLVAWPGLLATIARACAKEVGERHRTASELRSDLESCLGSLDALPALSPSQGEAHTATPRTVSRPRAAPEVHATLALGPDSLQPGARPPWLARVVALVRAHTLLVSIAAAAVVLLPISMAALARWLDERPLARARQLLESNRLEAAHDLLAPLVLRRPTDARLRVLQGRVLHRIEGQAAAGLDAYAAALALDPRALDEAALTDLVADLSRDTALALRSAQLLSRAGAAAIPGVLAAARSGSGEARLRALQVARELGAEDRLDRVEAYGALLADESCEVRRAAARRLGELGDRRALPQLAQLARGTRPIKPLIGQPQEVPVCGADAAQEAMRRIEAARVR